jgi:hypothetical protein
MDVITYCCYSAVIPAQTHQQAQDKVLPSPDHLPFLTRSLVDLTDL